MRVLKDRVYTEQLYSMEGIIGDELKYALQQVQIF